MNLNKTAVLLMISGLLQAASLPAQTTSPPSSTQFDASDFPQWSRDLRRAEIVAFGSFPFTMFAAIFAMDTYRFFDHDADQRYAPWPFKAAGALEMSVEEHQRTLLIAAGASVVISLTDFIIVQVNRGVEKRRIRNLPEGTPIIIRAPAARDSADDSSPDSAP
jgi:hypothetical protein